jgi:plastocyanin
MNHIVQITIIAGTSGDFVYTPAVLHVALQDTVTFASNLPFAVEFEDASPFNAQQVYGAPDGKNAFISAQHPVAGPRGQYHYAVGVWCAADQKVYLDAACPRISVN